jgi:hypothetical protein
VPENLVLACRRCNRARRSRPVVAYVRELDATPGRVPRRDLLTAALERLTASDRPAEASYGKRQLELLQRAVPAGG